MSKFSAEKPKGDAWGIEDVVAEMTEKILAGEKSPIIPIIGMIDIKKITVDPETGDHEAVVRIRRMESITTLERVRKAQTLMLEQVAERRGEGTILPFEEADIIARAFGGKPVGDTLQDDQEREIDADLDDQGRMLRHIVSVHDYDAAVLALQDPDVVAAALHWHDDQHAVDPDDRTLPDHDPESDVWRRVDLADMLAEAEEPTLTTEEAVAALTDERETENDQAAPAPLFVDGQIADPEADPDDQEQ
jgi:hypothetical protein